jgi:hypothetical protein
VARRAQVPLAARRRSNLPLAEFAGPGRGAGTKAHGNAFGLIERLFADAAIGFAGTDAMRTRQQYGSAVYRARARQALSSAAEMAEGRDKDMMLEIAEVYRQMADDRARFEEAEDRANAEALAQARWLSSLGDRINRSLGLVRARTQHLGQ